MEILADFEWSSLLTWGNKAFIIHGEDTVRNNHVYTKLWQQAFYINQSSLLVAPGIGLLQ